MSLRQVIHTEDEIRRIRRAARLTADVRDALPGLAHPGMSTLELDEIAGALIRETGGKSAFRGYGDFPAYICISVNDEVVHGIARADRILQEDDVVSIDLGIAIDGAVGDTALTFTFREPDEAVARLLKGTHEALLAGCAAAKHGCYVRDVSAAVEKVGKHYHLGIVREYVGHGCGTRLHEPPEVPNYVMPSRGAQLLPGMVICIEPMFNLGTERVTTDRIDHWTVRTADHQPSAHFEHMVLITENEPEVLTWPKTM